MARQDNLVKSKSIYTIRKRHAVTTAGTIYENDYTTIVSNDDIYNDDMVLFSDSNFKFRVDKGNGDKKKHVRDSWVLPDDGASAWTKNSLSGYVESDETQIINKPNYSSLKDFAYYGSAVELIKATVNDVILRFPGGLSYYDSSIAPKVTIPDGSYSGTYDSVSNEFEIDCWTAGNVFSGDVKNPMRVLAASYMYYEDKDGNDIDAPSFSAFSYCVNSVIGKVNFGKGDFLVYMDGNHKNHLIVPSSARTGKGAEVIITPKKEIKDKFWKSLDDFERVLLNRTTKPIYKATFDTPYQTEDGFFYSSKDYVWPTVDGFSPDVTTAKFQGYLQALIKLAQFHDEYDSDNIWRMMTHESIKNLDWTFIRDVDDTDEEVAMDSSRVQAMLHVWGRQFDDLKRYADNIKSTSNISYDEKNNIPDYFLSDVIENDGWEAKNVAPAEDSEATTSDIIYTGSSTQGYKPSDSNINFLRRLALSSDYIQSLKGTRAGLEAILHLFGYEEDSGGTKSAGTYTINEYIRVSSGCSGGTFPLNYRDTGYLRATCDYALYDENTNLMDGYPVIVIDPSENNDEAKYFLMPWFDKNVNYKYPFYFQSRGGWGKFATKKINLPDITTVTTLTYDNIYEETEPYMKYADNLDEMLSIPNNELEEGMVCYVIDNSGMDAYKAKTGEELPTGDSYSHYFVLEKIVLSTHLGCVTDGPYAGCYGWKNVYMSKFKDVDKDTGDTDAKKVVYLETLTADYKNNNPHTGKGRYDEGEEYVAKYNRLFSDAINDGVYDRLRDEDKTMWDKILNIGFNIGLPVVCNNKCQFFYSEGYESTWAAGGETIDVKKYNYFNPLLPILGSGKTYEETAAYSVMNVKNLVITFNAEGNEYLKDYFKNVVLRYLEPMIPSTAILRYKFDDDKNSTTAVNIFGVIPGKLTKVVGHAMIPETAPDYFIDSELYNKYIKK